MREAILLFTHLLCLIHFIKYFVCFTLIPSNLYFKTLQTSHLSTVSVITTCRWHFIPLGQRGTPAWGWDVDLENATALNIGYGMECSAGKLLLLKVWNNHITHVSDIGLP